MAPAAASPIDDDASLQTFDGTPVQMAYWFQHTGDKSSELMERGAITLLERGIAVTPRTQVVVYNRLHMLCRQAVTDLSVIEYSYKNPPQARCIGPPNLTLRRQQSLQRARQNAHAPWRPGRL